MNSIRQHIMGQIIESSKAPDPNCRCGKYHEPLPKGYDIVEETAKVLANNMAKAVDSEILENIGKLNETK
jgi:hypothetical protein